MNRIIRISGILIFIQLIFTGYSCKKDKPGVATIITTTMSDVTFTSAVSGGTVTNDGGATIVSRGVCWNTSGNPSLVDECTVDDGGSGSFTSNITGLTPYTSYYLRGYATNIAGTAYGQQLSFNTSCTIADADGNVYNTITIGSQTWMKENLKTTQFSDGTVIPPVIGRIDWYYLSGPGYCWYDNSADNLAAYGALYSWFTIDARSNGHKNICPSGWHVPTDTEWSSLISYLGGDSAAVGKLRETGNSHWPDPNAGATNESGFTALPGGGCDFNGAYYDLGLNGHWWSSTEFVSGGAWSWYIGNDSSGVNHQGRYEQDGFSVRCIKNR